MKLLSKIFSLGVTTIATSSPLAAVTTNTNTMKIAEEIVSTRDANGEGETDCCTVTYFGKNTTASGLPIIARATDCSPRAVNLKLQRYERNALANKTIRGVDGFEYTMPSTTYAYIACPLSPKTLEEHKYWQNNGQNEMGVGTSATLTCYANDAALAADPYVATGIGEETFTHVCTPQADTAKKYMQVAASIIDTHGTNDANIIMAIDQNEAWLMEIYTGHQYCAVKLPDDKVCVAGNEFILDTLADLGIDESNAEERCICSPSLKKLADDNGFAKYKDGNDIYHLNLFETYARPLCTKDAEGEELTNTDGCHMRTWRGYSFFDKYTESTKTYEYDKKYAPFFVPKDESGNVRKDLDEHDVMEVYRDQYDELVEGEKAQQRFVKGYEENTLRYIAVERTRAIHILTSDPALPKEIACQEWYCPSGGNYAPFVLINNGLNSIEGEYGYYPDRFSFDENCAACTFRALNALCWDYRKAYGYPVQNYWRAFEYVYNTQMKQVIYDAAKSYNITDARDIITNFSKHIRDIHCQAVKDVIKDLIWHIMDEDPKGDRTTFVPLVDLQTYITNLGWTNYSYKNNEVTCKFGDNKLTLDLGSGVYGEKGIIDVNGIKKQIDVNVRDGKVFVGMDVLNTAIAGKTQIKTITLSDYLSPKTSAAVWIVPLVVTVVLAAGIVIYLVIRRKKNGKVVITAETKAA